MAAAWELADSSSMRSCNGARACARALLVFVKPLLRLLCVDSVHSTYVLVCDKVAIGTRVGAPRAIAVGSSGLAGVAMSLVASSLVWLRSRSHADACSRSFESSNTVAKLDRGARRPAATNETCFYADRKSLKGRVIGYRTHSYASDRRSASPPSRARFARRVEIADCRSARAFLWLRGRPRG